MMLAHLLRAAALSIAVLALIDPSCAAERRDRPLVSLVTDGTAVDSARVRRLGERLADRWTVVRGWLPAADATVVLGDAWPAAFARELPTSPVFVVPPPVREPSLRWQALETPVTARLGEAVPVRVRVSGVATVRDSLVSTVQQGDVAVAQHTVSVASLIGGDSADVPPNAAALTPFTFDMPLGVVAVDTGPLVLRVSVALVGTGRDAPAPLRGDALVQVTSAPTRVLSYDTRPSWQATFVRRALEADTRLQVASRVGTSRVGEQAVALEVAGPPSLAALPDPRRWPVVVVGAAHALSEREVALLSPWVRRGGSVVLLLDDLPGEPVQRWLDRRAWQVRELPVPTAAVAPGPAAGDSLVGQRWVVPTSGVGDAEVWLAAAAGSGRVTQPLVWARPLGDGTLIVSGAADAWEARAPSRSGFAALWPTLVLQAADRVPPARVVRVQPAVAAAGAWREVTWEAPVDVPANATVARATVASVISANAIPANAIPANAIPATATHAGPGRWRAAWRAHDGVWPWPTSDSAPVPIVSGAHTVQPPQPALLAALAAATGGAVLDPDGLDAVGDALAGSVVAAKRRVPWHPMRSPWWVLPFAGALVAEWWLRRRRGLP